MRVPQVKERVKESPASALRAMFAGIGSMLFVKDKIRHRAGAENSTPETTAAAPESTVTPEATAATEAPAAPETVAAEAPAAPETVAAETAATPEVSTGPETAAAPEAGAALPLPNYDELTIASLRARLRNLSVEQLNELIGYEKEHANREDVISMFERRITKLNLGLTQALPKITE
jgi:hypothetical protein